MEPRAEVLVAIPRRSPVFAQLWSGHAERRAADGGLALRLIGDPLADEAAWRQALLGCDAVITSWGAPAFSAGLLAGNRRLRVLAHAAGSVADLVTPALYAQGVQVISANPVMAAGVAEWCLTMSLIGHSRLTAVAGLGGALPLRWAARDGYRSLRSATVGVWGFGAVARRYVELLRPLGPRAIAVTADYPCSAELAAAGLRELPLEELFDACDVVVLAAGLTAATSGRIGAGLLARLRDGATLINCGRARLVDEEALVATARQGRVTICLDVFHQEPPPADHPLAACANVVMTPHVGGIGTCAEYIPALLDQLAEFFAGRPLAGAISQERARTMTSHALARA